MQVLRNSYPFIWCCICEGLSCFYVLGLSGTVCESDVNGFWLLFMVSVVVRKLSLRGILLADGQVYKPRGDKRRMLVERDWR